MNKIIVFIFTIILLGCTVRDDQSSGDLFSIKVTDAAGMPVSGLDVRVNNSFSNEMYYGRPSTVIGFVLPEEGNVNLDIYDLYNQHVCHLIDGIFTPDDIYTVVWNGKNNENEAVNVGGTNIFKYKLTVTDPDDSSNVVFEDSRFMCMELLTESEQSKIGETDAEGRFVFNNLNAFPHIFNDGLGEQPRIDENGNTIGTFTLSDSINIRLVNPETNEYMLFTVDMDDSDSNHYDLIWDAPQPLAPFRDIILESFTGYQSDNDCVVLSWTTSMEYELAGFNLYRNDEAIQESSYQINPELISASYDPEGAEYAYPDEELSVEEITYYYWLETVDFNGITELYGPVSVAIVIDDNENPFIYGLMQNYPNPFH
ncbi:MAG: hypothetical protein K9N06_01480 [Candidatus Cloacimonetes bacterium]|nr:hypothetical protein [Candidatus Cloacimonadota bacterium]